jgi:hypothetical protein
LLEGARYDARFEWRSASEERAHSIEDEGGRGLGETRDFATGVV